MTNPAETKQETALWPRLACAGLLIVGALGVAVYALAVWAPAGHFKGLKPGYCLTACGTVAVLGALVWARVRDAALAAVILLDILAVIAAVLTLAAAKAKVSLTLPLILVLASLAAAVVFPRRRGRGVRVGVGAQVGYFLGLALFVGLHSTAAMGRAAVWILLIGAGAVLAQWCRSLPTQPLWRPLANLPGWGKGALVFLVAVVGFAAASGPRLGRPSPNNHFVYLADCYLHGRLSLSEKQLARKTKYKQTDDWARVVRLELRRDVRAGKRVLRAGTKLRGKWLHHNHRPSDRFRTTGGLVVRLARGDYKPLADQWYISFPPFPAVLMMPGVAVMGYAFNDVVFTLLVAALNVLLLFLLLGRLRAEGVIERDDGEILWLTLLFSFGTVNYFVSVRGEVWFTAQIVGLLCLLCYLHAAIGARYPLLAGIALGCAVGSRVTLVFATPIIFFEWWRVRQRGRQAAVPWLEAAGPALRFGAPMLVIAILLMWNNAARFGSVFEFGHRYLEIFWRQRIEEFGLFDVHYLSRNLAAMLTFLPHFQPEAPYFLVTRHGLSLLFVTPILMLLAWPRRTGGWHRLLWICVAPMLLMVLLYHNTGFVQFSYRFALDFTPLLILLLAVGGRPIGRTAKVLILWGIVINAFGAFSFGIAHEFYGRTNWVWTPLDPSCRC